MSCPPSINMRARGSAARAGYQKSFILSPQQLLKLPLVIGRNQYRHENHHEHDAWQGLHLMRFIADEGDNHAVEVEEEHEQVEAQFDEGFLLVHIELSEDFRRVQKVLVLKDLLSVPCQQRQIQDQCDPVSVDKEEEGQEGVYGGLGDDVCVQAVAQVNGVDVVAFQVAVHNGEEDLKEQVDGIYQHRQQVQPRLTSHCGDVVC